MEWANNLKPGDEVVYESASFSKPVLICIVESVTDETVLLEDGFGEFDKKNGELTGMYPYGIRRISEVTPAAIKKIKRRKRK